MATSAIVGILKVLLTADTAQFESGMKAAATQADSFAKGFSTFGRQATALGSAMTKTLTLPILGLGVGAIKAAADFESSFANVAKTVDGVSDKAGNLTKEGEALAGVMRQIAKEIPATTNELNAIAALGGQMGVPIDQLAHFTRNVAALGVAVDGISAEEAAAGLAQIGNITGTGTKDIQQMASALVHLGNSSNATEGDILEFSKRMMGTGHAVGMTVPDVMALSTAMANVGINAEAGATAMNAVISKMSKAVSTGGASLNEFARVAGMSATQFAEAFHRSPIEAVDAFVKGLSTMRGRGADLNVTMGDLGTEGVRVAGMLKSLAGAGDGVSKSLITANEGFASGNKHLEEADKKYATTKNQLKLLWNQISDVGIELGTAMLPAMKDLIHAATNLVPVLEMLIKGFTALPGWVQGTAIGAVALAAAIGPVIWAFGTLSSAAGTVIGAFGKKGIATRALTALMQSSIVTSGRFATALGLLGKAAGVTAAFFAGWQFGKLIDEWTGASDAVGWLSAKLGEMVGLLPKGAAAQYDAMRAAQRAAEAAKEQAAALDEAGEAMVGVGQYAEKLGPHLDQVTGATYQTEEQLKAAAARAKAFADSLKALGGADAIGGAQEVVRQLNALNGPLNVLPSKLAEMAARLREGAEAALLKGHGQLARDYGLLADTLDPVIWFQQRYNVTLRDFATDARTAGDFSGELSDQVHRLKGEVITIGPALLKSSMDLSRFLAPLKGSVDQVAPGIKSFKALGDAAKNLGSTILQAVQGGGSVFQSVGSSLGAALGTDLVSNFGKNVTKMFGPALGGAINSVLPGIGALLGPLAGKLASSLSSLFGIGLNAEVRKANTEIEKLRQGLLETHGTLDDLEAAANRVGISFRANWGHQGQAGLKAMNELIAEFEARTKAVAAASDSVVTGFGAVATGMTAPWLALGKRIDDATTKASDANAKLRELQANEASDAGAIATAQSELAMATGALNVLLAQQQTEAAGARQSLQDLGVQGVAAFGAALLAGDTYGEAMKKVGPSLATLGESYQALGLEVEDVGLKNLILQATVAKGNPDLLAAVDGLAGSMNGLAQLGLLNIDTFGAMQRTGSEMYARLQGDVATLGGTTRDALLPMQGYLQEAAAKAELLGIPLDENTQLLIAQSQELGIWKDKAKSSTDRVIDGMQALVDKVSLLIDRIMGIGSELGKIPSTKVITFQAAYSDPGPPSDFGAGSGAAGSTPAAATHPGTYDLNGDGRDENGYRTGTWGRLGQWYGNFPATGMSTVLHGMEAVITPNQAPAFALDTLAGMGLGAGASDTDFGAMRQDLARLRSAFERMGDRLGDRMESSFRTAVAQLG